jgi:uncharacterized lipoprotein YmbA
MAAAMTLLLVAPACSSVSAPTRFYALTPIAVSKPASADRKLAIGLDPVVIPGYLDRPQIVTRATPDRFMLAEFDQWGEPFLGLVTRILAEDLYQLTDAKEVTVLPQSQETRLDRLVHVVMLRFDAEASAVILKADWKIFDRNEKELAGGRFETQSPVSSVGNYDGLVAAMSQSLGRLAQTIADAIAGRPAH